VTADGDAAGSMITTGVVVPAYCANARLPYMVVVTPPHLNVDRIAATVVTRPIDWLDPDLLVITAVAPATMTMIGRFIPGARRVVSAVVPNIEEQVEDAFTFVFVPVAVVATIVIAIVVYVVTAVRIVTAIVTSGIAAALIALTALVTIVRSVGVARCHDDGEDGCGCQ
jgi:hypothetical protein